MANPDNRTRSPMTFGGEELPDWTDVNDPDGYVGSDHRTPGRTDHYDAEGNLKTYTDDEGRLYDQDGNEIFDDDADEY